MNIIDAIIQGLVQGLTEFLPVSSSGHLSLIQHFTGQNGEAGGMFSILLHMGTLIAVFIAFYQTIWDLIVEFFRMLGDIFTGKFSFRRLSPARRMIFLLIVSLFPLVLTLVFKDAFDSVTTDGDIIVEGVCFLVTAGLLYLSDKVVKGHKDAGNMNYLDAVVIGTAQAIAPLPGISRSGSTLSAGLVMGLEREYAVAFSFIMGVPAVFGANLLELKDIISGAAVPFSPVVVVTGMAVAAVSGLAAIRMVKWLVKSDKFKWFALYTLILGIVVIGIGIFENISGAPLIQMFQA